MIIEHIIFCLYKDRNEIYELFFFVDKYFVNGYKTSTSTSKNEWICVGWHYFFFLLLIMISFDSVAYRFQMWKYKVIGNTWALTVSCASEETTLLAFWKQGIFSVYLLKIETESKTVLVRTALSFVGDFIILCVLLDRRMCVLCRSI
jgi:hypothetical protein